MLLTPRANHCPMCTSMTRKVDRSTCLSTLAGKISVSRRKPARITNSQGLALKRETTTASTVFTRDTGQSVNRMTEFPLPPPFPACLHPARRQIQPRQALVLRVHQQLLLRPLIPRVLSQLHERDLQPKA